MAVFCTIVEAANSTPDDTLFPVFCPCRALVSGATFAAVYTVRESIFAGITGLPGHRVLGRTAESHAPCHLRLYSIVGRPIYNGRVIVLDQVHRAFSIVFDRLMRDAVGGIGLLHQNIPAVFFTGEDALDCGMGPVTGALGICNIALFEPLLNLTETCSSEVSGIDFSYDLRLLWDDLRLIIRAAAVSVQFLYWMRVLPSFMDC